MDHPSAANSSFTAAQNRSPDGCSLSHTFRCETKIANLTYRISFLVNFLSVSTELLEFVFSCSANFLSYQKQIITITELARKTLESAGVVIYLWASCPKHLMPHKAAYIDLLRMLQSNESYVVDNKLKKRLRVLLMPLTSHFVVSERGNIQIDKRSEPSNSSHLGTGSSSTSSELENHQFSSFGDDESSAMPPPDPFLDPMDPKIVWSKEILAPKPRPEKLWHRHELRTRRSRSAHHRNNMDDQENVVPAPVPFYQPPKQRFGIFCTGKSSMLNKRKDRNGRPAH